MRGREDPEDLRLRTETGEKEQDFMKETTLVHIIKDGCVLMLHRITKEHDINHGKWIGVGGKFEWGETPEECMRREVYEETGLRIDQYRYCGIVTFVSDEDDMEYMHLFTVTGFHDARGAFVRDGRSLSGAQEIRLKACDEGVLEWLPEHMLTRIPHWAGDRIFLSMILGTQFPFFSMKLVYRKGELVHASVQEHNCLVTERLILRPWLEEDAAALYEAAKNPKIGPAAGWQPHRDMADSRKTIREVLSRPEIYAILLRDTSDPVGAVGLQNFRIAGSDGSLISYFDERKSPDPLCCTRQEGGEEENAAGNGVSGETDPAAMLPEGICLEAALGYWLAEPHWHQGIMAEAVQAVLDHGRRDLGLSRVWADYFEGNEASRRVMDRAGFHFHHIEKNRYVELLGEERTAIYQVLDLRHL